MDKFYTENYMIWKWQSKNYRLKPITKYNGKLGLANFNVSILIKDVTENVLIYLGIPFLADFLKRYFLVKLKGIEWYNRKFRATMSP